MGAGWLNFGSLVLGIAAWGLPAAALLLTPGGRPGQAGRTWCAAGSLGACGAALWLQILYGAHLARIRDWSAVMDTAESAALVSGVLLAGTLLLNGALLAWGAARNAKNAQERGPGRVNARPAR
ncbi:hypothetical protein [Allofournierella sp.]|uniref:hypothetical protein n=1 Tax=Allofournierella sp. TaxID=1940256 RepID=UPI003AB66267